MLKGHAAVKTAAADGPEQGRRMGGVSEHIRSGLLNGYRTGVGRWIRLFLTNMKLQKEIFHSGSPSSTILTHQTR